MLTDSSEIITVKSNITGHEFARFAMYDTFGRRKAWRAPLLFAVLMGAFSLVCFTVLGDREQASLLGTVLLSIGLVLPTVWLLMYIFSVRKQIKKFGLSRYKTQYTLLFKEDGIHVANGKETAQFAWSEVRLLVEDKGCAYLYMESGRAFLMPDGADCKKAIELAKTKLPQTKIKGKNN